MITSQSDVQINISCKKRFVPVYVTYLVKICKEYSTFQLEINYEFLEKKVQKMFLILDKIVAFHIPCHNFLLCFEPLHFIALNLYSLNHNIR